MAMQIELKHLLIEERNRISEELHDRVSAQLFSIVYAIDSLRHGWNDIEEERKLDQLLEIQKAAASASRELRAAIYRLSSQHNGRASWIGAVELLLSSQAKLNGVRIRFQGPETDCRLSVRHQNVLYRIISEGVSNAIRHGACSIVDVKLALDPDFVKLTIADNGTGFDLLPRDSDKFDSGFGIRNMRELAVSLAGRFEIESRRGRGTRIRVWLPLADANKGVGQNLKMG